MACVTQYLFLLLFISREPTPCYTMCCLPCHNCRVPVSDCCGPYDMAALLARQDGDGMGGDDDAEPAEAGVPYPSFSATPTPEEEVEEAKIEALLAQQDGMNGMA